jgi:hypothetical protein
MSNVKVAVWTIVIIAVVLVLYKFVFNPQIIIIPSVRNLTGCPDKWRYDGLMCNPTYQTICQPFNPKSIQTLSEACKICKECGTNWSGQCS